MPYSLFTFWPHRGIYVAVPGEGTEHIRTVHYPTQPSTEVIMAVTTFAPQYNTSIGIVLDPEISNDGQNFEALTSLRFSGLAYPQTQIKKQTKVGAFQRYDFKLMGEEGQGGTAGLNALIVALMRFPDPDVPSMSFDEIVDYLNEMRLGFNPVMPEGAGSCLPFWPLDTALASDDGSGNSRIVYTQALPTADFTEVVACLDARSFIGNADWSFLNVCPEI